MDYLQKIPDTADHKKAYEEDGFFIKKGKYFRYEVKSVRGQNEPKYIEVELSNFVGESIAHLVNGTNNSKRIIKLQRNTGQVSIVEVQSSEMKLDSFETILKSKQNTFFGSATNLKKIFAHWMDHETEAHIIETLGHNYEHDIFVFSNAVCRYDGKVLEVDNIGMISNPETNKKYYLPAFGLAHKDDQDYEGERKFLFVKGKLHFDEWAKLYSEAFKSNGEIAILFLILSLFWDVVFREVGFFPFLFLFGAAGTGKTTMVENLLRIFGRDYIGIPLNNATQVALSRTIASRNNSIFYLKEYTTETDEANQDLILTAYDGSGRATGIKSNDNRTKTATVRSSIIFDGNQLPTQKSAVLSRMILLNFESNNFDEKQRTAFNNIEAIQQEGFGNVLTDILKHREYFTKHFRDTFRENIQELRKKNKADFAERTLKHVALILTPAKLLVNKLQFPFEYDKITEHVLNNAKEQNQLLKQSDEVTIFWQAFSYGIKNNNLIQFNENLKNHKFSHYNIKYEEGDPDPILQIKLKDVYPEYVKYCRNNSQRFLDKNSLRMLLTSKSYKPFIKNTQKGRGDAYTDGSFGSCYQFRFEKQDGVFLINEVEINM